VLFPAVRHEVSFWRGNVRLSGDLRLPASPGPHPVVLMVREPDCLGRDYSAWLDAMAGAGIASFSWDRPHHGSDAEEPAQRTGHQAREVLAAVDRLRSLAELDARATVLMGWGEGGWGAAQAATFSNQIAALILACTPAAGLPESGTGFDPRPSLSAVTVPVLALFGEQDPRVPLEGSVRGVRDALRDAGHSRYEVAVVRGADHELRVRPPHGLGPMIDGRHRFGDWPPGLTDLIVAWLRRHLRPDVVPAYPPPPHAPMLRAPVPQASAPQVPAAQVPVGSRSALWLPPPVPVRQVRRRVTR
jgi:dienelactone hydrolase